MRKGLNIELRLEGGEGVSHVDIWGRNTPGRKIARAKIDLWLGSWSLHQLPLESDQFSQWISATTSFLQDVKSAKAQSLTDLCSSRPPMCIKEPRIVVSPQQRGSSQDPTCVTFQSCCLCPLDTETVPEEVDIETVPEEQGQDREEGREKRRDAF